MCSRVVCKNKKKVGKKQKQTIETCDENIEAHLESNTTPADHWRQIDAIVNLRL